MPCAACLPERGRTFLLLFTLFSFCSTSTPSNGDSWGYDRGHDQPRELCKLSHLLQEGLFIRSSLPTGLDFVDEVLLASCSSLVIQPPANIPREKNRPGVAGGNETAGGGGFSGGDMGFDDRDLAILFRALEKMPHVQKLSLRNFPLSSRAAPALVRLLRHTSNLRSLDLWNSSLTRHHRDVFKDVLEALHAHPSMQHLNLGSNNLLDEHMATVASMLAKGGGSIETLNLGDNSITAIGLQLLLKVVNSTSSAAKPHQQRLKKLVMSGNQRPARAMLQQSNVRQRQPSESLPSLGNQFLAALSTFVAGPTAVQLKRFDCDRCGISDQGLGAFVRAIRNGTTCPHLTVLHFRENDVGSDGLEALIELAERGGVLSDVQLAGNRRLSDTVDDNYAQVQSSMYQLQQILAANGLRGLPVRSATGSDSSSDVNEDSENDDDDGDGDVDTEAAWGRNRSTGNSTEQKAEKAETVDSQLYEACLSVAADKGSSRPFHRVAWFSQLLRDVSPDNEDFMQLWHQQQ